MTLFLQREIDSIKVINKNSTREFEAPVRLAYQAYLVNIDPSLEAATEIIRKLRKQGVKFSEFLSLHCLALEELARRLPPEKFTARGWEELLLGPRGYHGSESSPYQEFKEEKNERFFQW